MKKKILVQVEMEVSIRSGSDFVLRQIKQALENKFIDGEVKKIQVVVKDNVIA
jgi:hypothetical protein